MVVSISYVCNQQTRRSKQFANGPSDAVIHAIQKLSADHEAKQSERLGTLQAEHRDSLSEMEQRLSKLELRTVELFEQMKSQQTEQLAGLEKRVIKAVREAL